MPSLAITDRLAPTSGVAGAALVFLGLTTASEAVASTNPSAPAASIAATLADGRGSMRLGVTLALAGVSLLFWFLADLRRRIGDAEGRSGRLRHVAFGGGLLALGGVVLYAALLVAASNESIGGSPEAAQALVVLLWEFGGVLAPTFAALVAGTSIAVLRYRLLPRALRWPAWLGLPLGLALAVSGFFGGALVVASVLWLLVVAAAFTIAPGRSVQAA
jgi:hypothetical protein